MELAEKPSSSRGEQVETNVSPHTMKHDKSLETTLYIVYFIHIGDVDGMNTFARGLL